jgi:hypothetical protein
MPQYTSIQHNNLKKIRSKWPALWRHKSPLHFYVSEKHVHKINYTFNDSENIVHFH